MGWAMGRFDSCERWKCDNGTNGVFLLDNNHSTYVDKTSAAWNTAAADPPITKRVLLGYCEPFDAGYIYIGNAGKHPASRSRGSIGEARRGAPLKLTADAVNGPETEPRCAFYCCVNWAMKAENGSRQKWWVRRTVSGSRFHTCCVADSRR